MDRRALQRYIDSCGQDKPIVVSYVQDCSNLDDVALRRLRNKNCLEEVLARADHGHAAQARAHRPLRLGPGGVGLQPHRRPLRGGLEPLESASFPTKYELFFYLWER